MPLADRLVVKQVCACMALPGPWFVQPTYPSHWYDAILLPVFNQSAGLSPQNVTVRPLPECWDTQDLHHMQLLTAVVGGNGLDFVSAVATSLDW